MISMTGYGYAERTDDEVHALVDVKSVNNRYLDINVSLPGSLSALEPVVRERVAAAATRGRVDILIRARDLQESLAVSVDQVALRGYLGALSELRNALGTAGEPTVDQLLRFESILRVERSQDRDRYWQFIEPMLSEALDAFAESRKTEGAQLREDIARQLGRVNVCVETIAAHSGEIEAQIRGGLVDRFHEVLGDVIEENRLLAEVAVQLTRFSINEEIVRLRAHLDSFRHTMDGSGAVGKKLDFVCQEMNREINTVGSKSILVPVSQQVVEAKDALENVREQLRNIE